MIAKTRYTTTEKGKEQMTTTGNDMMICSENF